MTIGKANSKTLIPVLLFVTLISWPIQAQTYAVLHRFAGGPTDGASPAGSLIQDSSGNTYGVTIYGGSAGVGNGGFGTIYKLDTSGVLTVLHSFTGGDDGGYPNAGLFLDNDGSVYGTNGIGGDATCQCGTVFKLDTNHVLTILHKFKGNPDGAFGTSDKLISINGVLYGATTHGGESGCFMGCGTIFKISKGGTETVLYRFTGGADSNYPISLIRDRAGNLYGTTAGSYSSTLGQGTVFELDSSGNFSTLYTFTGGADGHTPFGHLLRDQNGNFHGVTPFGGKGSCYSFPTGCGVVFRLAPSGSEAVIHDFFGDVNGHTPQTGLLDVSGVLYGTTSGGGSDADSCKESCGLIYQIDQTGQYNVVYRFAGGKDGWHPVNEELMFGSDGSIYGATFRGGLGTCRSGGCGVIFKYTP